MKRYWSTRGELTVVQNILLKGTRIVIPSSMRLEILDKIHVGHQGIAKCRERAKSSVWWPGLSREIQDLTAQNSQILQKSGGFKHVTSSPRFPQSNGEVERGVRTVKNLLQKAEDPAKGLLAYRSTPLACKFSPAQLLMGRKLRNSVPMFHTELNPHWPDLEKLHARESESKLKQQSNFNLRHKATPLTPLEPGTEVHVRNLDRPGVVVKAAETPRSYEVKTPISTVRRNRVHLTPMPEQRENQPVPAEDKIAAPVQADQPKLKMNSQAAPATPLLANRPKRLLKPSLKVRENLGLI